MPYDHFMRHALYPFDPVCGKIKINNIAFNFEYKVQCCQQSLFKQDDLKNMCFGESKIFRSFDLIYKYSEYSK